MTDSESRRKIVFLDASTLALDLQPLAARGGLVAHETTTPEQRAGRVATAEVIVTNTFWAGSHRRPTTHCSTPRSPT